MQMLREGSGESVPLGWGVQGALFPHLPVSEPLGPALSCPLTPYLDQLCLFAFLFCSFYWF